MKLQGERTIARGRDEVWGALNDPEVLKACIPGCQSLDKVSDTQFDAVVKQKVGPVSATFKGSVELSELDPPNGYRISGEGKGGAAGFAKGGAVVALEEVEGGTRLTYDADASVGGKMAQLGARLIDGFAKKMADQFFEKFEAEVVGAAGVDAAPAAGAAAAVADKVSDVADAARERAEGALDAVRERADDAREQAEAVADQAREKVDELKETVAGARDKVDELKETAAAAREKVEDVADTAREQVAEAKSKGFFGWLRGLFG